MLVVSKFGGRRMKPSPTNFPPSVKSWGTWDCDPTQSKPPTQHHAYGQTFPWTFDRCEKAYILQGTATLTPDDSAKHGAPITIVPGDMVTWPRGWKGQWVVHSFLSKRYAFFDGKGVRIDEEEDDDDEEEEAVEAEAHAQANASRSSSNTSTNDSLKRTLGNNSGKDDPRLRKRTKVDYSMFDTLTLRKDSEAFHEVLRNSKCQPFNPERLEGKDVTGLALAASGFDTPFLVPDKTGLGLYIPDGLSVPLVVEKVGPFTKIPVLDVGTQQGRSMTLGEWGEYWELGSERVNKMGQLNVISMEVSHTELGSLIKTPQAVRDIDWIDTVWKARGGDLTMNFPRVQLYCLMGTAGSYTDFHIDFGGTSVWYHIVSGEKWFYLIPPTPENLRAYESWTSSASQNAVFFPDMLAPGTCTQLKFTTGNTLFIPSGWIHAVYTPRDTLVFGGNFLHNMSAHVQLKVYDLENRTHVPQKYQFPNYRILYRHVVTHYLNRLREELFGWRELSGLDGYHRVFNTAYSDDVSTLQTRLRGAELSVESGPNKSEDFDRWVFLHKCLWRQMMRLKRAQKQEAEKRRMIMKVVEGEEEGAGGGRVSGKVVMELVESGQGGESSVSYQPSPVKQEPEQQDQQLVPQQSVPQQSVPQQPVPQTEEEPTPMEIDHFLQQQQVKEVNFLMQLDAQEEVDAEEAIYLKQEKEKVIVEIPVTMIPVKRMLSRCKNIDVLIKRESLEVQLGLLIEMKPFNNSKTDWILVTAVKENSLGHQFGLQVNDRIITVNGTKCKDINEMTIIVKPLLNFTFRIKRQVMTEVIKMVRQDPDEEGFVEWMNERKLHWNSLRTGKGGKSGNNGNDGNDGNNNKMSSSSSSFAMETTVKQEIIVEEETQPDTLLSINELRTLYKVVCHLENWSKSHVNQSELLELKQLVQTRLNAMGEGDHPDEDQEHVKKSSTSSSSSSSSTSLKNKKKKKAIVHWAQCESCKKWRVLKTAVGTYDSFVCKDRNRLCTEKEDVSTSHIENGYHDDTTTPSNDIGWGRGRPVYITSKDNETPLAIAKQLQLKPRQSATSALVKQNRMSSGGRLKGLASKSKLYEGTVLLLPWSSSFELGASYVTARDDETPSSICILLGMETSIRDIVSLNRTIYKGLNSKSKFMKGTILKLPPKEAKKARVVSRKPLAKFAESWKKDE